MARSADSRVAVHRILVVIFSLMATTALAVVVNIVADPDNPILGTQTNCTPEHSDPSQGYDPPKSFTWSLKKVFPNGSTPWQQVGTDDHYNLTVEVPITYQVQLVTDYRKRDPSHTPPAQTKRQKDFGIAPADGSRVVSGLNQDVPAGGSITVLFQVTSGGQDRGTSITGLAQERITNLVETGLPPYLPRSWWPDAPSPTFSLAGGQIRDEHTAAMHHWSSIPVGGVIAQGTQELRIIWSDPWGNIGEQLPGTYQFVHHKTSATTWQIQH
jgi:hypothetical protein